MEQKQIKRGWVKNAAIIFLSVMLVLTFFSNTWMNRSLPEVAQIAVQSGTITTQIRGTGVVTANETYEVKLDQSRVVQSVPVRTGDTVSVGDTLLLLKEGDSSDLETAKSELEAAELAYQTKLLTMTQKDYTLENREVQRMKEDLQELIAKRDASLITDSDYNAAKADAKAKQSAVDQLTAEIAEIERQMSGLNPGGGDGGSSAQVNQLNQLKKAIEQAKQDRNAAELLYGADYAIFKAIALETQQADNSQYTLDAYMAAQYERYAAEGAGTVTYKEKEYDCAVLAAAYRGIKDADTAIDAAQKAYDDALAAYEDSFVGDDSYEYNKLNKQKKELETQLADAEALSKESAAKVADMETKRSEYDSLASQVKESQRSLEDKIYTLAQSQKEGANAEALEQLELNQLSKDVAEKRELVSKLSGGSAGSEILSDVNGVIKSINVSAGSTAGSGEALITIEVPDRGYGLSFSVTNEQAQKVAIGDAAEVTSYYWGSPVNATLVGIKNDPESQGKNKLLVFSLSGDGIESGVSYSLAIGQRSMQYELVVPNSAVRTDNNGSFVLVIESRSSPLGNRYYAQRVDVQVLASDDQNTAISGGLSSWGDYVITTSAKPIESGDMVRLPDA